MQDQRGCCTCCFWKGPSCHDALMLRVETAGTDQLQDELSQLKKKLHSLEETWGVDVSAALSEPRQGGLARIC